MWQTLGQSVHATGARVMLTYLALDAGAGDVALTAVTAAQAVPALVAAFVVGRVADRRGGRPLLGAGYLLAVVAVATLLVADGLGVLVTCSVLLGASNLAFAIGQQALIGARAHGRDAAFSTYAAVISVGQVVGAPLATLAAQGWHTSALPGSLEPRVGMLAMLVALLASAAGLPRVLRGDAHVAPGGARSGAWGSARAVAAVPGLWPMVLASGATLAVLDLLQVFLPVWGESHGVPALTVSLLLALRGVLTLASRLALPGLLRRFRRRGVLCWSSAGAAAGLLLLPTGSEVGAAVAMVVVGFCLGLPQPISLAWVSQAVPAGFRSAALGLRLTANRLAQVVLPPTVAALPGAGGSGVFFGSTALLAAMTGVLAGSGPEYDAPPDDPSAPQPSHNN